MNGSEPSQRARSAALRLLSHRPRSEAEIRRRLSGRYPPSAIDQAVRSLRDQGLLDDAAFARMWRDSRDSSRPRSAAAIRRELVSKGVDRQVADETVQDVDDEDAAYRAGLAFVRRLERADLATFRRRLGGHLERRGFRWGLSRTVVDRLWQETRGGDEG